MILLITALSFCLLGLEVTLLRALAFLQWYHFAYLIISLAMLGFGAAGTAHHLLEVFLKRHAHKTVAVLFLTTGMSIGLIRPLMVLLPQDSFLAVFHSSQWGGLAAMVGLLFLPFLLGALTLLSVFTLYPKKMGWLYGANLAGSGAGAIGALFFLDGHHPLDVLDFLGLVTTILALAPAWLAGRRYVLSGIACVLAVFALGQYRPDTLPISQYKDLARTLLMPQTRIVAEGYDPRGVVTVVASPYLRSAAGLSLTFSGHIPARPMIYLNGASLDTFPRTDKPEDSDYLHHTLYALPYSLRAPESVLVPHSGAGGELLLAHMKGSGRIVALEPNRTLVRIAMAGVPGFPTAYDEPGVEIHNQDARAYLEHSKERFDLIAMPTVSGQTSVSSAMRSIYEDYLMTVDSFSSMFQRLTDNGMIRCSVSLDAPPRRPMRFFAILVETLRRQGITDPAKHLLVVRSWNLTLFLLSRKPFDSVELGKAVIWASDKGFDTVFPMGQGGVPQHRSVDGDIGETLAKIAAGEAVSTPFNIYPPTDEHPYFEHFLTWKAAKLLRDRYGPAGLLLLEWGYVMVWLTFATLFVGGGLLVLLPLWVRYRKRSFAMSGGAFSLLGYFAGIGAGFMLVEMLLIQKLTMVLGDPVYAVGAVLAALLVFAGLGSISSGRWTLHPSKLAILGGAALVLMVFLFWQMFPWFYEMVAPLSLFPGRLLSVIAAMAPMAWLMGWFFPNGMRAILLHAEEEGIPLAWAINGFFSVISGCAGVIIALNSSLTAVAVTGLVCYAGAVFAMTRYSRLH